MPTSSTFTATDGNAYELQMGRWSRRLAEPFLDFVGTEDGERILDVGCGTGGLTIPAKSQAGPTGAVHGIDAAPEMIEVARRKAAVSDVDVDFQVGLIEDIPFPEDEFEYLYSIRIRPRRPTTRPRELNPSLMHNTQL